MPTESLNSIQTYENDNNTCVWKSPCIVELTPVDAVDVQTESVLPTAGEYQEQDRAYVQGYWELQSRKWSEPKYLCPVCEKGGMRRDETVVLTSNPPSYRYECDNCHHITYHHI